MRGRKAGDYAKATLSAVSSQPGSGGKSIAVFIMNRKQLEHLVRASGSISGCRDVVIIGSQALTEQTIRGLLSELTPDNATHASHRLQSTLSDNTTL